MAWTDEKPRGRVNDAPYVLAFPMALVIVDAAERYLETRFFDGTYVPAQAQDTPEDIQRAATLGYLEPDPVWQMTLDHDLWHLWLGRGVSPVLWGQAHPDQAPSADAAAAEEAHVLGRQERHDKAEPRPWESSRLVRRGPLWGWPSNQDGGKGTRHIWVDVYHGPSGLGTEVPDHSRPLEGLR